MHTATKLRSPRKKNPTNIGLTYTPWAWRTTRYTVSILENRLFMTKSWGGGVILGRRCGLLELCSSKAELQLDVASGEFLVQVVEQRVVGAIVKLPTDGARHRVAELVADLRKREPFRSREVVHAEHRERESVVERQIFEAGGCDVLELFGLLEQDLIAPAHFFVDASFDLGDGAGDGQVCWVPHLQLIDALGVVAALALPVEHVFADILGNHTERSEGPIEPEHVVELAVGRVDFVFVDGHAVGGFAAHSEFVAKGRGEVGPDHLMRVDL